MSSLFLWGIGAAFTFGIASGLNEENMPPKETALAVLSALFVWPLLLGYVVGQLLRRIKP